MEDQTGASAPSPDAPASLVTADVTALSTADVTALVPGTDLPPVASTVDPVSGVDSTDTTELPSESFIEKIEGAVEGAFEGAVAAVENVAHVIEHRSFGRPSADHPMTVKNVIGGL